MCNKNCLIQKQKHTCECTVCEYINNTSHFLVSCLHAYSVWVYSVYVWNKNHITCRTYSVAYPYSFIKQLELRYCVIHGKHFVYENKHSNSELLEYRWILKYKSKSNSYTHTTHQMLLRKQIYWYQKRQYTKIWEGEMSGPSSSSD